MEKYLEFKFTIPFIYTISQRLSTPVQILFYLIHNLFFPLVFFLFLKVNFSLIFFLNLWFFTHLVYEIGYFMNDNFASDSRSSSRTNIDLKKNSKISIFFIKTISVFISSYFFVPVDFYFILIALFFIYIIHNKLKKENRIPTFILLRILKFAPFWFLLKDFQLYIFIFFFATLSFKESLNSYKNKSILTNYIDLTFFIVSFACLYYGFIILSIFILIYVFNKKLRSYALCFFSNK